MKSIFVLFLAFAIAYPAQGLLLSSISNAINSLTDTVNGVISTTQNVINTGSFIGQILWDNAFGPSWEMFLNGGADFIDNYFGGILNAIGKKRELEVRLEFSAVQQAFHTEASILIAQFKSLFQEFVAETIQHVQISILNILFGQTTINEVFGDILTKFKSYIAQAVQSAVSSFNSALNNIGPEAVQLTATLTQQLQSAGALFQTEINMISSFAINAVNQGLAFFYNEFDDLVVYFKSQVDRLMADINKIIASSLIGILFGITTVDNILTSLINKAKEYAIETLQYTVSYVSQKVLALYIQYQPYINQVLNFVTQFNLNNLTQLNIPFLNQAMSYVQQLLTGANGLLLPPFSLELISPTIINIVNQLLP